MSDDIIPYAAGEPARRMIRDWAESHGMTLYQGREGEKYPVRRYMKLASDPWWDWEYEPWSGYGPAIAQIGRYMAIPDADDEQARELVASWDLPPHFATRGVSYSKQVVTEHHYFSCFEGLERLLGMCPGLDLLCNPHDQELWIKVYDEGYEVLSTQPGRRVPALPDNVVSLYRQAAEEQRQRSAADGEVPVGRYRTEGIEYGWQNPELYRSACSLAARRAQPDEITSVLAEIVEHSDTDPARPWRADQLATMADRAYRRYGKPPIVVEQMAMEDLDPDQDLELYQDQDQELEPERGPDQELEQGPEQGQENLSRHAAVPRLRVAPPAELAEWADEVVQAVLAPVREVTDAARPADPGAGDAQWGDMGKALFAVELAAEVLGWLGDVDLVDYQRAEAILRSVVLPAEYTDTLEGGMGADLDGVFTVRFLAGWNKGAAEGHEVPAGLQPALDAWHPPCPLAREDIEEHRLPPGREGRWPVQNHVAMIDDRGNARRLLDHYGDRILFVDGQKGLGEFAFDGTRWLDVPSGGPGLVAEFADKTIGALAVTEAMSLSVAVSRFDKDGPVSDRGRYWRWLNMQQSNARRSGMITSAVAIPGMRVPVSVFDANPRWLNTETGEIDLGRAEIGDSGTWSVAEPVVFHPGQHYPEHFHSRITGAAYDPEAASPEWEQALKGWLLGDEEMIAYLGKLVAASVRGMTTLKVIPLLLGSGNSGKSTFLEVVMGVLGSYATTAAPSILRKGKGGGTLSDDVAELRGYRFVTTTETHGAEEMDEPRIKRLSGGDRQRARGLYQSSSEFDVQFLLWFATNAMPRLSGEDTALWIRFPPVMFPGMWTETGLAPGGRKCNRADPNLKTVLMAEGSGILNWVIAHLEKLYAEGLAEPKAVTAKRRELQGQQDTSGQFIAMAKAASNPASGITAVSPRDPLLAAAARMRIRWTSLYRHYEAWAAFGKINAVGKDAFKASLANHGHKFVNRSGVPSVTGFGHRKNEVMAQCPVCEEMLPEPEKQKEPKGTARR